MRKMERAILVGVWVLVIGVVFLCLLALFLVA